MTGDLIREKAEELTEYLRKVRRDLHRIPEPGGSEKKTSAMVAGFLGDLNLEVTLIGENGLTALWRGKGEGRCIALRADMDALPIEEPPNCEFRSLHPGYMHACGHDAHMAILLGTARMLRDMSPPWPGTVKFIFQPCEEVLPGGALGMIDRGVLSQPPVDAIYGLHVNPFLPAGHVGYRNGTVMAATDAFQMRILGRGGHGSAPHQTIDPIYAASLIIQAVQSLVSRRTDPQDPLVISFGQVSGGERYNIIPEAVILTGTARCLNPDLRENLPGMLEEVVSNAAASCGARAEVQYMKGYPPLENDSQATRLLHKAAAEITGEEKTYDVCRSSMGGDDFAYYARRVPASYFFLGTGGVHPWHSSRFTLEEGALPIGTAVLTNLIRLFLTLPPVYNKKRPEAAPG